MLEKPGTQNTVAREKHGKQRELSDYWKSILLILLKKKKKKKQGMTQKKTKIFTEKKKKKKQKITRDDAKKDKNIDWNTSVNKRVYILQNLISKALRKRKKVTQLVNPINYYEIPINTWSN